MDQNLTLLGMTQEFCRRRGLPVPLSVVSSTSDTVRQIWGLLNECMEDLAERFAAGQLRFRHTFTHAGGTNYNALDLREFGPIPDFSSLVNETLWDDTNRRPVYGPLTPQQWELLLVMNVSQAVYSFTTFGNALRIYPAPAPLSSVTFSFEYETRFGVMDPRDAMHEIYYANFLLDTDVTRFPRALTLASLKWRWNQAKGLPYAEDFRTAEEMITNWISRDVGSAINMGDDCPFDKVAAPGLLVAAGNWPIP